MSTITISLTGSAIAGLTGTQTKAYTVSDADLQLLLNWATVRFAGTLGASPANTAVLVAWIQSWVNDTTHAVQVFGTTPPAPISIA
jgi:hypothetical protein